MTSRPVLAVAMTAMLGATAFFAAGAFAQQPAPMPMPMPAPPPGASDSAASRPATGARPLSAEDRAAFIDAHIAALRAGLRLTPEQERLWPSVEQALREGMAKRAETMQAMQNRARPANPIESMQRMGEAAIARGEAMRKLAEAAQPLYASLSDDQKQRLSLLMRGGRGRMMQMHGMMHRDGMNRDGRGADGRGGDERGAREPMNRRFGDDDRRGPPPGMMGPRFGDDRRGMMEPRREMRPRDEQMRPREDQTRPRDEQTRPRDDRRGMMGPRGGDERFDRPRQGFGDAPRDRNQDRFREDFRDNDGGRSRGQRGSRPRDEERYRDDAPRGEFRGCRDLAPRGGRDNEERL